MSEVTLYEDIKDELAQEDVDMAIAELPSETEEE